MIAFLLVSMLACAPAFQDEDPVELRGAWISAADADVLASNAAIGRAMEFLYESGFNAVFPVVWSGGLPLARSQLFEGVTGFDVDPRFAKRDPFAALVIEAHRVGLEVYPAIEDGFACADKGPGHALLDKKPSWAACGKDGKPFLDAGRAWINALDPEVQTFCIDWIKELLANDEIDGLVFDGAPLALPVACGYDAKTSAAYRASSKVDPSADPKFKPWLEWRTAELTRFTERLHKEALAIDPNLRFVHVSRAGGIEYAHDVKAWFERGLFDLEVPRISARDRDTYVQAIGALAVPGADMRKIAPLLTIADKGWNAANELVVEWIAFDREKKLAGEVLAPFEALRAEDGKWITPIQEKPYYAVSTLPWRGGERWRPVCEFVQPKAGEGEWQWRTDSESRKVLELAGGVHGDASWGFLAPSTGVYDLYMWIAPDADVGTRVSITIATTQGNKTKVIDPSCSSKFRGWVFVGRTAMKRHEEREIARITTDEKDVTKVTTAGPLVALLSHRSKSL